MPIIKNDEQFVNACTVVSENLKNFVHRLNAKDKLINWDILTIDNCMQNDGSYFRVVSTIRTATEQIKLYKQGRGGVKYETQILLFPDEECKNTPAERYVLKDRGKIISAKDICTNAWAGESYHNWGLAIDLVLRKFGDVKEVTTTMGSFTSKPYKVSIGEYYRRIGLLDLARECGVEWGGLWADFPDVAHFQDTAYSLPASDYCWNKNMNIGFIEKKDGVQVKESGIEKFKQTYNKITTLGTLGFIGALYYFFKGGKKR